MTVEELIAELRDFPPYWRVEVDPLNGSRPHELEHVLGRTTPTGATVLLR